MTSSICGSITSMNINKCCQLHYLVFFILFQQRWIKRENNGFYSIFWLSIHGIKHILLAFNHINYYRPHCLLYFKSRHWILPFNYIVQPSSNLIPNLIGEYGLNYIVSNREARYTLDLLRVNHIVRALNRNILFFSFYFLITTTAVAFTPTPQINDSLRSI